MSRDISHALFIGATMRAAADAREYMDEVKLPAQFTNPGTVKAVAKRRELEEERTAQYDWPAMVWSAGIYHQPVLALLSSAAIVDRGGGIIWAGTQRSERTRAEIATPFLGKLQELCPKQFGVSLVDSTTETSNILFGFNLKEVLRIAALEYIKELPGSHLPIRLWHNPVGVYDPVDIILPSAAQKVIATRALCEYLGIEADMGAVATDCVHAAQLARKITLAAQLVRSG